jgi:hypothetical protein
VTVNIPLEDHSRIDDFLPDHDFSASYDIRVQAPASAVYERRLSLDFGKLRVVRALMMIRTGKRPPRKTVSGDLRQRLQGTGFVILVEVPNQELVMGVAGRFWRPEGGRYMELTADDFTPTRRLPLLYEAPHKDPPRTTLPDLFAPATRRLPGISGCAQSRPGVRSFQPRPESNVSDQVLSGHFECIGAWLARSPA